MAVLARFVSNLVCIPEDRFSHDVAQSLLPTVERLLFIKKNTGQPGFAKSMVHSFFLTES